jgi:SAM-dependent methyltransferase
MRHLVFWRGWPVDQMSRDVFHWDHNGIPLACSSGDGTVDRGYDRPGRCTVGFYQEQLLPRFQDKFMGRKSTHEVRARVCADLHGEIVEIGFGTGLNARFYPPDVERVLAIEPSAVCMAIAEPRIAGTAATVELAGLMGERLDLPSESFDAVLSTWTLCTIPELDTALSEIDRVLKPGGTFHFVEHGHAPDPSVAQWQRRIEPFNKMVAGGCHLTRRIPERIESAGFTVDRLDSYYFKGEPRPFGYTFEGHATKA